MQKIGSVAFLLLAFAMFSGLLWASTESVMATALVLAGTAAFVLGSNRVLDRNRARRGKAFTLVADPRDLLALTGRDWAWLALILVTGAGLCIAGVLAAARQAS